MNVSRQDGDLSILDFSLSCWSEGVQHFVECQKLGLFSKKELLAVFKEAGMIAEFRGDALTNRGIFIARAK